MIFYLNKKSNFLYNQKFKYLLIGLFFLKESWFVQFFVKFTYNSTHFHHKLFMKNKFWITI
jgi:hypothetical protein